jgi:hypothetical protein
MLPVNRTMRHSIGRPFLSAPSIRSCFASCASSRLSATERNKSRYRGLGPFPKGKLGNPGGITKQFAQCKRLCREASPDAARRLIELIQSEDERVALMVADKVFERASGKPKEYDPNAESIKKPPPFDPSLYTTEELRRMQGTTLVFRRPCMLAAILSDARFATARRGSNGHSARWFGIANAEAPCGRDRGCRRPRRRSRRSCAEGHECGHRR